MTRKEKENYLNQKEILGSFKTFFGEKVEILNIINGRKGMKSVVLRYYLESYKQWYLKVCMIKYNLVHQQGYFEFDGVVSLDNGYKKYNKMTINWNIEWDKIQELLNE